MPPSVERLTLADEAVRAWARHAGYGVSSPIPADVPPFEPSRGADGSAHPLRVHADAYVWVMRHALALNFHEVAREWLRDHADELGAEEADADVPPVDEDVPPF